MKKTRIVFLWQKGFRGVFSGSLLSFCIFWSPGAVGFSPSSTDEEASIPYEQIVRELKSRVGENRRQSARAIHNDPFKDLQIHFSLGWVQTVSSMDIQGRSVNRMEDGIQLGMGIELFSKEWVGEGLLKNYGQSHQDGVILGLREFDLRLSYLQISSDSSFKLRFSNGLGARYLRLKSWDGQWEHYGATPTYILGLGARVSMGSHFDLEFDTQAYRSLIDETADHHGLSLGLRLVNTF